MADELARLRDGLADQVVAATRIRSERAAAALHAVPRHLFLPDLAPAEAYRDDAIVTKRDEAGLPISSSSQPAIMAVMLDQLDLSPGQRVLEIGAGTGYNAALLRHIVGPQGQVTSIDIDAELVEQARGRLASAGVSDVTVICADGTEGHPERAPYDRVIATVGVDDLAPAWLAQAAAQARVVVPLDVRGTQLSVAFERTGPAGPWVSRSLAPCGFMRLRGPRVGTESLVILAPGVGLYLPGEAAALADGPAMAGWLAGPSVTEPTGVRAGSAQVFWGLNLWLAASDPRWCRLSEEQPDDAPPPGDRMPSDPYGGVLGAAPLRGPGGRSTLGLADASGTAILTADGPVADGLTRSAEQRPLLEATGFGPGAARLAAELAAHVRAWDPTAQPELAGLHLDAYPRLGGSAIGPEPVPGTVMIERPATRFAIYHD